MPEELVVDASVAARWFLTYRADADVAEDILLAILSGDIVGHAPRLFTYEVCGLLTKACNTRDPTTNQPRLTPEQAVRCVNQLFALPMSIGEATEEEGTAALALAVYHHKLHSDMTYLRMAEHLDSRWCTADEKILIGSRPDFPVKRVVILATLRSS